MDLFALEQVTIKKENEQEFLPELRWKFRMDMSDLSGIREALVQFKGSKFRGSNGRWLSRDYIITLVNLSEKIIRLRSIIKLLSF